MHNKLFAPRISDQSDQSDLSYSQDAAWRELMVCGTGSCMSEEIGNAHMPRFEWVVSTASGLLGHKADKRS